MALQRDVERHQLGHRGRIPRIGRVLGAQDFSAVGVDQNQRFRARRRSPTRRRRRQAPRWRWNRKQDRAQAPGDNWYKARVAVRSLVGPEGPPGFSRKVHEAWAHPYLNPSRARRQRPIRLCLKPCGSRLSQGKTTKVRRGRNNYDSLHRGMGAYALRQACRRDRREPDRAGRGRGAGRCRDRRQRRRRDRARPLQCRLLGAGFYRLAGAAGLAGSAFQARDASRECLRHRFGCGASGAERDRGAARADSCSWSASSR